MIKHIIFDVDKTIYPESCGFGGEMDKRISLYTATFIDIPLKEANELRKRSLKQYGTTLQWLQQEHGLSDTDHYLDAVHPENVEEYLPNREEVNNTFNKIPVPMSILSNGPIENVNRILNYYQINHLFNPIIDIKMNNMVGKPNISAYKMILDKIDCPIGEILFIDDVEDYLIPFHEMGGNVLLINEKNKPTKMGFSQIKTILSLPDYLKSEFNVV